MVPSDERDRHDGVPDGATGTDGGRNPGFDEAALYVVVREAVEDAILGAVGTLLLVGIAFVPVWTGFVAATSARTPAGIAVGGSVALGGLYLAAATLGVVPPFREWV